MLIPKKPKYELVAPGEIGEDENWKVRITGGKFKGTLFHFDTITPTEEELKYSFHIDESPAKGLTKQNKALRKTVENILIQILKKEMYGSASD